MGLSRGERPHAAPRVMHSGQGLWVLGTPDIPWVSPGEATRDRQTDREGTRSCRAKRQAVRQLTRR